MAACCYRTPHRHGVAFIIAGTKRNFNYFFPIRCPSRENMEHRRVKVAVGYIYVQGCSSYVVVFGFHYLFAPSKAALPSSPLSVRGRKENCKDKAAPHGLFVSLHKDGFDIICVSHITTQTIEDGSADPDCSILFLCFCRE